MKGWGIKASSRKALAGLSALGLLLAGAALSGACDTEDESTPVTDGTGGSATGGSAGSGGSAAAGGGTGGTGATAGSGGGGPEVDDDGDGYAEVDGDCDDTDPLVNPSQPEVAGSGKDDNCDGLSFGAEQSLGTQGRQLDVAIEPDRDLHLVYTRNMQVFYRRQAGGTWDLMEREVPVGGTYYPWWWPHVGVDSAGAAHLGWADWQANVWYTRFDGAFSALVSAINDDVGDGDTNRNDLVVLGDDTVFIAAQSDFAIAHSAKPPGGSFSPEAAIFTDVSEPQFPSLAVSPADGSVHCIYAHNEAQEGLQYSLGTFNGSWSWQPPERPAGDGGGCCANASSITVDQDGRAHVAWIAWRSGTNYSDLMYTRRNLNGSWSPIRTFFSIPDYFTCHDNTDECNLAQIAVADTGTVLLVFANGGASSEVFYFVKHPGLPWSDEAEHLAFVDDNSDLVNDAIPQNYPVVIAQGSTFFVLWSDGRGAIYLRSIESIPPEPVAPQP